MATQPVGTVTLLFTDVEGSTRLLERLGTEPYAAVLDQHRRLLRGAFVRNDGYEFGTEGDALFVAFSRAEDAIAAAGEGGQARTVRTRTDSRLYTLEREMFLVSLTGQASATSLARGLADERLAALQALREARAAAPPARP